MRAGGQVAVFAAEPGVDEIERPLGFGDTAGEFVALAAQHRGAFGRVHRGQDRPDVVKTYAGLFGLQDRGHPELVG